MEVMHRVGAAEGAGHPDGEQRSFLIQHQRVHALVHPPASPGWSFMAVSLSLWPLITSGGVHLGQGVLQLGGAGKNGFQGDTPPPSHAHIYHQTRCFEGEGPAQALPSSSYSWDYPITVSQMKIALLDCFPIYICGTRSRQHRREKPPRRDPLWLTRERQ